MYMPPQKSHFILIRGLVVTGILVSLLAHTPVRADVGPQPVLPGGSSLKPGGETPIQMASEVIVMTVRPATSADNALVNLTPRTYGLQSSQVWYPGIAEVAADFTMRNPTGQAVSMSVWFPLASALQKVGWRSGGEVPSLADFQVSVDGELLGHAVNQLPNPQGAEKPALPWASFPVTFPAGKDTNIHISYLLPLQPAVKSPEMVLYYVFQTGAGWAGTIGQAELVLNLPYPASAGTLGGSPPGGLSLPPMYLTGPSGLPGGAVLKGNQARWKWQNFEPGPGDDFSVWLLRPDKWQQLETARAVVQARPQDGVAWLDLATIYQSLSMDGFSFHLFIFSPTYLRLGLQAYQKAADLLPGHPAAHSGLGLLSLAPYLASRNAPQTVFQSAQREFQIAQVLEAENPSLAKDGGISSAVLERAISVYLYNNATATVEAATQAVFNAAYTAEATLQYATRTAAASLKATSAACSRNTGSACATATPTATPARTPVPTQSPLPSGTPLPPPETPTGRATGAAVDILILVVAGILGLAILAYAAWRIFRQVVGKH